MTHFRDMNGYEKAIVIALFVLFAVFTVLYVITTSQAGYAYRDTILVHSTENGNTVYSGEIEDKEAHFTVTPEGSVTFVCGNKTYGPYTVKEDMTAIPEDTLCTVGLEVRDKDEIIFRGGYGVASGYRFYYNEDGSSYNAGDFYASASNGGIVMDADGNIIDTMEPSVSTILTLLEGPQLKHRGSWGMWILCTVLVVMTLVSVFFADALFRWRLSFHVRDADTLEPSTWEIDRRIIRWGVSVLLILIIYIVGLK